MSIQILNTNRNDKPTHSIEGWLVNENIDNEIISKLESTKDFLSAASVCRSWRRTASMVFTKRQMESIQSTVSSIIVLLPVIGDPLSKLEWLVKNNNLSIVKTINTRATIRAELTNQLIKDKNFKEKAKLLMQDSSQSQELRTIVANGQILIAKPQGGALQPEIDSWSYEAVLHSLASGQATQAEEYAARIKNDFFKDFALQKIVGYYSETNQLEKAELAFKKIKSPTTKTTSAKNILNAHIKKGDLKSAETWVLKIDDSYEKEQAYIRLADAFAKKHQFEKSFEIVDKIKDSEVKYKYLSDKLISLKKEDFVKSNDSRMESYEFEKFKSLFLEKSTKYLMSIQNENERSNEICRFFESLAKKKFIQQAAFIYDLAPSDHKKRSEMLNTLSIICITEIDSQIEKGNFERAQQITWHLRDSDWKDKMLERIFKACLKSQKLKNAEQVASLIQNPNKRFELHILLRNHKKLP